MSLLKICKVTSIFWLTWLLFSIVFIAFGIYVYTENEVDIANNERQAAFQLASDLRQSSDNLTQMAGLYVITKNPRYKQYYQSILDIRNGKIPRPKGYDASYWDLVIAGTLPPPPQANGTGTPLVDVIHQSGFTNEEVSNLVTAKNNSEALTKIEFEAMTLVESVGADAEAKRAEAHKLLFGENYYQAKSKIVQPINTFYHLMDKRTLTVVNQAIYIASLYRLVFIVVTLFVILILWRSYTILKRTLGGTAKEVHQLISSISQGDLSAIIQVTPDMENSVIAGLSKMQSILLVNEAERNITARALQKNITRMQAIFETQAIGMVVIDKSCQIEAFNAASEDLFGYTRDEVMGRNVNILMPEPYHSEHDGYIDHYIKTGEKKIIGSGREVIGKHKNGTTFSMQLLVGDISVNDESAFIGFVQNITERKRLEANSKLFELLVKSSDDAIITKQLDGTITSWNPGAQALFGYSAEEMIGQSINKLMPPECYHEEEIIRTIVSQKQPVKQLETVRLHKDGSLIDVSLTLSPIIDETDTVIGISKVVRDIRELKQSMIQIQTMAFYDPLTGLPNRRLLLDRLKNALPLSERDQQYGALLFLDIDHFKAINDDQGHDAGDKLLVEIATRLRSCLRESETVARIGGDEFVVLLENLSADTNKASNIAVHIAEKIRNALVTPYTINGLLHYSSSSIGVYLFLGKKDSVDDIVKHADMAMYQAKNSGRNCVHFYDVVLQKQVATYNALKFDLVQALAEQQFQLHYQIQIDQNSNPIGAEALIRWQHPKRGIVPPAEFIPVAEDSGLILKIGNWVLDRACLQIAAWSHHPLTRDLVLSVNVSGKEFKQPEFAEIVKSLIKKHRIKPSCLKLELTESVALDNFEQAIAEMLVLKVGVGVKLSLDDFGTGFSSLSCLKKLPINEVKIDQSFIRNMDTDTNSIDAKMVKTIIDMAHNFNLDVMAEGVETNTQLALLKNLGCLNYQGYLFSKPVPIDAFEALLKNYKLKPPKIPTT
jgi:diguanylate cyclase (GGDEF)-like protein/PAS domain S-box-containing protein